MVQTKTSLSNGTKKVRDNVLKYFKEVINMFSKTGKREIMIALAKKRESIYDAVWSMCYDTNTIEITHKNTFSIFFIFHYT